MQKDWLAITMQLLFLPVVNTQYHKTAKQNQDFKKELVEPHKEKKGGTVNHTWKPKIS